MLSTDTPKGMSSDPLVSEVAATTGNSLPKRLLNGECERKNDSQEKPSFKNVTRVIGTDGDNPRKRVKIETATAGEGVTSENDASKPADTNDSTTAESLPSLLTSCNDEKIKGGNGANIGSENVARPGAGNINDGIDVAASQSETPSESHESSSPAVTRSQSVSTEHSTDKEGNNTLRDGAGHNSSAESKERWRVHQMAEDYTSFVGSMMYPATQFQPYGYNPEERQYPIEKISLLGFIKSPLRRPTIIEKWSPYEIAVFEGSMLHYGKEFRNVSRQIGTKTTQEVIDFYYIWKKTAHYKKWKEQYISDEDLIDQFHVPLKKPKR